MFNIDQAVQRFQGQLAAADRDPQTGDLVPEATLQLIDSLAGVLYACSTRVGCHAVIEFTGLLREFGKVCRRAHEQGIDFQHANTHSGISLPFLPHEVAYLSEKLECIYQGLVMPVASDDAVAGPAAEQAA